MAGGIRPKANRGKRLEPFMDNNEPMLNLRVQAGEFDLSIIVVDDNSPDGTAEILKTLQQTLPKLQVINRSGKLGYGSAHVAAFQSAISQSADIIISMDADFSHDPKHIPELVQAIEHGADVAIGSRKIPGGQIIGWSPWRTFSSGGAMMLSRLLLNIKTKDVTSGYRAYRRSVLTSIHFAHIRSNGYSFLEEILYLIERHGFTVKEVPITFNDRTLGRSKLSKKEILKFFLAMFRLRLARRENVRREKTKQPA